MRIRKFNESKSEKLFLVHGVDDYGRDNGDHFGIWRASDKNEARKLASIKFDIEEMITTGFYDAEEVDEKYLTNKRNSLKKQLDMLEIMN